MNTKTRPVYIIERDIRETMDKAAKAVRQGRYMDAAILAERADNLKEELSYATISTCSLPTCRTGDMSLCRNGNGRGAN